MTGPTSLRWRLLRSAAFALVAAQLAAFGHMVGGGEAPDPAILLIGAATIGAIGTGLTRRQRSAVVIFPVMLVCQVAFHLLFTVDVHAMPGAQMFLPADLGRMLIFHVVAAAASAVVLATGDAAIFGLYRALRRAVLLAPPVLNASRPMWTAGFADESRLRPTGPLLRISPRRGPPAVR